MYRYCAYLQRKGDAKVSSEDSSGIILCARGKLRFQEEMLLAIPAGTSYIHNQRSYYGSNAYMYTYNGDPEK